MDRIAIMSSSRIYIETHPGCFGGRKQSGGSKQPTAAEPATTSPVSGRVRLGVVVTQVGTAIITTSTSATTAAAAARTHAILNELTG